MADLLKRRRLIYSTYGGETPDERNYLTFTVTSPGTVGWDWNDKYNESTLEFSINNKKWKKASKTKNFYVNTGDVIKWRGLNTKNGDENGLHRRGTFVGSAKINVSGNLLSIVYTDFDTRTDVSGHSTFLGLFYDHKGVVDCSGLILPNTGGGYQNVYEQTFMGCSNLTIPPSMTNITRFNSVRTCYQMFEGCTSLTETPKLLVDSYITTNVFSRMFYGCTALVNAVNIIFSRNSSHNQNSCTSMFEACTSLQSTPLLLSTTLASGCYSSMFKGCTNLIQMPALPAVDLADNCYKGMFRNCVSLREVRVLPAKTLKNNCYDSMFGGCTSLTHSPEIQATVIYTNSGAMQNMFYGCSSLNTITVIGGTTYNVETYGWIYGVSATGTFITAATSRWNVDSGHGTYAGIPIGWTREDYTEPA